MELGFEVHTPADLPQVWNLRYLLRSWLGGFQSQSRRCNENENLSACSQSIIGPPGREVGPYWLWNNLTAFCAS